MDSSPVAFTHKHSASVLSLTLCGADRWRTASFRLRLSCVGWLRCRTRARVQHKRRQTDLLRWLLKVSCCSDQNQEEGRLISGLEIAYLTDWVNSQSSVKHSFANNSLKLWFHGVDVCFSRVSQMYRNEISCKRSEQRRERLDDKTFLKG